MSHPNQVDVRREIVHLKGDAAKMELKCTEAGVDFPPRPVLKVAGDELEERSAMAAHVAVLKPKAGHADVIIRARKVNLDAASEAHNLVGAGLSAGSVSVLHDAASSPSTMSDSQIAAIVAERDGLKLQIEPLTAERDALRLRAESAEAKLEVVTKERDTLKANQLDFNKRVAAEICKFGIRSEAVQLAPEPKMNATTRALMAK